MDYCFQWNRNRKEDRSRTDLKNDVLNHDRNEKRLAKFRRDIRNVIESYNNFYKESNVLSQWIMIDN